MTHRAPHEARPQPDRTASQTDVVVRVTILAIIAYWSYLIMAPLLGLIVWSVILSVAAFPVFKRLSGAMGGRPVLAAVAIASLGLALAIGPAMLLANNMLDTFQVLYDGLQSGELRIPAPSDSVKGWPVVGDYAFRVWSAASTNIDRVIAHYADEISSLSQAALSPAAGILVETVKLLLAMILGAALLVFGSDMQSGLHRLVERATPGRGAEYFSIISLTIRNVAQGAIGVALIQAMAGGAVLIMFGIPFAGLLTFLALILGIIQIGTGVIFTTVGVIGLFTMELWSSVPMFVLLIMVTAIDNLLKPFFMGHRLDTPKVLILFSVMGGVALHGFIGVFLGPVVLTIFYQTIKHWMNGHAQGDAGI